MNNKCLTPREIEVINMIYQGLSNIEIADKLIVSTRTAKAHMHNIYKKLNVNGRWQLMAERIRELERENESKSNKCVN